MNANDLAKVLNSLTKHSLEYSRHAYSEYRDMNEDKAGEWVGCETLAKALGLEWDWVSGEFSVKGEKNG
jgi:hypothetical protein